MTNKHYKVKIAYSDSLHLMYTISKKILGFTTPNITAFNHFFTKELKVEPLFANIDINHNIFINGAMAIKYKGVIIACYQKINQEFYKTNDYYEHAQYSYNNGSYDESNNIISFSGDFNNLQQELYQKLMQILLLDNPNFTLDEETYNQDLDETGLDFLNKIVDNFKNVEKIEIPSDLSLYL